MSAPDDAHVAPSAVRSGRRGRSRALSNAAHVDMVRQGAGIFVGEGGQDETMVLGGKCRVPGSVKVMIPELRSGAGLLLGGATS